MSSMNFPFHQKQLLQGLVLSLACFGVAMLVVVGLVCWKATEYWYNFSSTTGVSWHQLYSELKTGWQQSLAVSNSGYRSYLLLGLDELSDRNQVTGLTDTMLLVTIDTQTGQVAMLSLPRDIWLESYQTKINALYYYGWLRQPTNPTAFVTEVISELTQLPIDQTVVVSLDSVSELVDILGGITIDVPESFTDSQFPRSDVDPNAISNASQLYQTVTFSAGTQHFDGQNTLKYIRSRKSLTDQGNDLSRTFRQQQVVSSLIDLLLTGDWLKKADKTAQTYLWYQKYYSEQLGIPELVSTGRKLLPVLKQVSLSSHQLPVELVLRHPPVLSTAYQGQWVYVIDDPIAFQASVSAALTPRLVEP